MDEPEKHTADAEWMKRVRQAVSQETAGERLPERIGRYRIIREIGRGGMGAVYEAEQDNPRRTVALKIIKPGVMSREHIRRFEHEAQILGRLQHPGIAQIFEAGVFGEGGETGGQPYFAMEFIRGQRLHDYAMQHFLSTRDRLRLMVKVCHAVQHAHQKGVIHRDLKPGNILVTDDSAPVGEASSTARAQPKILDFGIARATDADVQSATLRTDIGQLIGTIPYMSPEQAGGNPDELDTRSDVYALGVIAYQLLSGHLPYNLQKKFIHEAVRVIREDEPTRLASIDRALGGDVEIVIGKALEKERDRRYQSAQEFASDIERYLNDEPIVARPASTWYNARKFARRNKALVGGVAATFLALVAGLVTSLALLDQANTARASESKALIAEKERGDELNKVSTFQAEQLSGIDATTMGVRLRADLLNRRRESLKQGKHTEEEIRQSIAELEKSLVGVNFTDAALKTLDENIFDRALQAIDKQFADQPLVQARLLTSIAETLFILGNYDRAAAIQAKALDLRLAKLGDEHADTLRAKHNLGVALKAAGKLKDARPYLEETLAARRRLFGNGHPDTLQSIGDVGELLRFEGKLDEAEPFYRENLETSRRELGPNDAHTRKTVNDMGVLLQEQGQLEQAERFFREDLEMCRRTLGEENADTLTSMSNLANVLINQNKLDEAEPIVRKALEANRRVRGDDHPHTLSAINTMGGLLLSQRKIEEAEPYFREALNKHERLFGSDHPDTLTFMSNLGLLLRAQNKLDEAEEILRRAEAGYQRGSSLDHPDALATLNNLALVLQARGKPADAEPYFRTVIDGCRKALGNDHGHTLQSINNLGSVLIDQHKFQEAEDLLLPLATNLGSNLPSQAVLRLHVTSNIYKLFSLWHSAEPDKGYDAKAAEWKAKLAELEAPKLEVTAPK